MKATQSLALAFLASTSTALDWPTLQSETTPADRACQALHSSFPNETFASNQSQYTVDNTNYWSQASALGPACVFAPSKAQDLGKGVKILKKFNAPFAMRGGGHMPIGDFNNINSTGVLLSSSGFLQLTLSKDTKSVHVGPGNHWNAVYKYLEPHGLAVVGGRLGVVGVPGFVTGGGISFFGNQHGWASANVASFTVVLGDGRVVKATSKNKHSDLYWALRGGGNSFGLVTDLELLTYSAPVVTIGQATYNTTKDRFLASIHDFAINGSALDPKAAIVPIAGYTKNSNITYTAMRFYDGNNTHPAALSNFTAPHQPPITDTFTPRTLAAWTHESDASFSGILGRVRSRFYIVSLFADLAGMHIVHDTWFAHIAPRLHSLPTYTSGVAFMPISTRFFTASSTARGGDPMGIDPAAGPQVWIELSLIWSGGPETEDVVTAFLRDVDGLIKDGLKARGVRENRFLYLNDADKWQDVWGGYPRENVERLKRIRERYDPEGVFTDLMPGGWKVRDA